LEAHDAAQLVERGAERTPLAVGHADEAAVLIVLDGRRVAANVREVAQEEPPRRRVPLEGEHLAAVAGQAIRLAHAGEPPAKRMRAGRTAVGRARELLPVTPVVVHEDRAPPCLQPPAERLRPTEAERAGDVTATAGVVANELELVGRPKGKVHHLQEHLAGDGADRTAAAFAALPVFAAAFGVLTPVVAVLPLALLLSLAAAAGAATRAAAATGDDRSRIHAGNGDHVGGGCGAH